VPMVALIAAMAKNRVIGKAGKIPWNLPEDMAHFRELTMGHVIVMGRRTYEEIGHPLPGRRTYLISSTMQVEDENCHTVLSLQEVLKREKDNDIFICGGAMLYREGMEVADRLYMTEIDQEIEGDTYFPEINLDQFEVVDRQEQSGGFAFVEYRRV